MDESLHGWNFHSTFFALSVSILLYACGGGGSGPTTGSTTTPPPITVTVTCPNGTSATAAALDLANAACPVPKLLSISPTSGDSAVSPDIFAGVRVLTDSLLDPRSLTATLTAGGATVIGTVSVLPDMKGVEFDLAPTSKLSFNQSYGFSATLKDALGRALVVNIGFTTIPHTTCAVPAVWDGTSCVAPLSLAIVAGVSAGDEYSVALRSDGSLWSWGNNDKGQLGDGSTSVRIFPVLVGSGFSIVAAGYSHTLALKQDGTMWAWGWNSNGQLGDGTKSNQLNPIQIGAGFVALAANGAHSLAIKADGTLWAWGDNAAGELGDGTTTDRLLPVLVGTGFKSVATGYASTVAVKADGTLWTWGSNEEGQLGDGTAIARSAPAQIGIGYRAIAAGGGRGGGGIHILGLKLDGSLWAWGENGFGQFGDGTRITRTMPVLVGSGYTNIAAGKYHSIALKPDGSIWTWGGGFSGQLGNGIVNCGCYTPSQYGTGYSLIAGGGAHTLAVKTDGSIWTWGQNNFGQLGNGTIGFQVTPTQVGTGFSSVSANNAYSAATKSDGTIWAWGRYPPGGAYSAVPLQIDTGSSAVKAGWYRLFMKTTGGDWFSYGYPKELIGSYTDVAEGNGYTVAVKADGSLWAWGFNGRGALGDGTDTDRASPVQIGTGFSAVSAQISHAFALKPDGSLWSWGEGGALGYSTSDPCVCSKIPKLVGSGYSQVAVAWTHTVALRSDGTLWAWGANHAGQLGDGTANSHQDPVQVGAGYSAVAVGASHTAAIKTDGTLWTWGDNTRGQLGSGTLASNSTAPVLVGSGFRAVAAGDYHTVALKVDGSLWAWGSGSGADGTLSYQATPGQITGLNLGGL